MSKLFAKHFKIEEQQAALKSQGTFAAVGTPNRLLKLADLGDLQLDRLKLLMIDVQLDAKQRWEPLGMLFQHYNREQQCSGWQTDKHMQ